MSGTTGRARAILERAAEGDRISAAEARLLFDEAGLMDLGLAADSVRRRLHPDRVVTYIVDRNINYTNICVTKCSFCAFYRLPGDATEGYLHPKEVLFQKIEETLELGGTGILMQGGHHPTLPLEWYEDLLRSFKERYPTLHIHAFSPPEIQHIVHVSRRPLDEVLDRLKKAGLDSIPGGGGEILVDAVREKISPLKVSSGDWMAVMDHAHRLGIPSTVTMMFGHVESLDDRVEHLAKVREQQDRTGGFTAFIAWTYKPGNTELRGKETTSADYLRTQAIARLFVDNILNLQSSWVTQGTGIGQIALYYGANDMGSVMIEENVVRSAGNTYCTTRDELERLIAEAGYHPRQRDTLYRLVDGRSYPPTEIVTPAASLRAPVERLPRGGAEAPG
ncbi:MAG TPA: cyclic dehypoxanthinyl futalosine synthase [Candidatus Polarisedimenticolia bacterium]|nr:cyclic dehypoxanthinyl futalosine synthase [Candidatus Polarisedimenticolia bacterium]